MGPYVAHTNARYRERVTRIVGALLAGLLLVQAAAGATVGRNGVEASPALLAVQVLRSFGADVACVRAPCAAPAPGVRVTILHEDAVVARRTTDRAGRFRISLAPGTYRLRAANLFSLPKRGERNVVLRAGVTTRVTLLLVPPQKGTAGTDEPQ